MNSEDRYLKTDRMRYTKNTRSSRLAILAIVFNVVYFVSLYQSNVGSWYYNILMGASIVYNLVFMLAAFLSSEGVKSYKRNYSWLLLALAVIQIVRIFILPMRAHGATAAIGETEVQVMKDGQFTLLLVCLIASAACLTVSALINLAKCNALAAHKLAEPSA